ncbi:MarR family transcriptional regulator [Salinigranum salinum]|uniref:MarR family transcriptional regulator n=1 Tax=Salinigranum salinum TaxID=1364937 RepID=UPI001260B697|nr:HTH domain-containing protein [Salinigranum salinum]
MPREDDTPPDVSRVSGRRADVLSLLAERSGECVTGERALAAELGVSRSAADRTVRRLEASGLVRRAGGRIELTLAGRLAFAAYRRFGAETTAVRTFGDLLFELPPDADIDHDLLDGATAYRSEPSATGRPADAVTDLIGRARSLSGLCQRDQRLRGVRATLPAGRGTRGPRVGRLHGRPRGPPPRVVSREAS